MKDHIKSHSENGHECNLCDETFREKWEHMKNMHEGAGQFKCDYFKFTYGTNDESSSEEQIKKQRFKGNKTAHT